MDKNTEPLEEKAIAAALSGNWKLAVKINKQIISSYPADVDAHLRFGFASLQQGEVKMAEKAYRQALKIQPTNQIAKNNLEKIRILKKKRLTKKTTSEEKYSVDPTMFINIAGRTKIVPLINIGQADVLAQLRVGQQVFLRIKKRRIEVRNKEGDYIGVLPDDISKRLIHFIEADSRYNAYVKEASKNQVYLFIKEEKKGRRVNKYTSFPKNMQEDLKIMMAAQEEEEEDEDEGEEESIDIEKIAEKIEEEEFYPAKKIDEDEDEYEE